MSSRGRGRQKILEVLDGLWGASFNRFVSIVYMLHPLQFIFSTDLDEWSLNQSPHSNHRSPNHISLQVRKGDRGSKFRLEPEELRRGPGGWVPPAAGGRKFGILRVVYDLWGALFNRFWHGIYLLKKDAIYPPFRVQRETRGKLKALYISQQFSS